jgi:hypothetical protein
VPHHEIPQCVGKPLLYFVEEFLNLSKNAAAKVEAGDAVAKDAICRIIFLNLKIDEEKVANYLLKEPFATLFKTRSVKTGRGERI